MHRRQIPPRLPHAGIEFPYLAAVADCVHANRSKRLGELKLRESSRGSVGAYLFREIGIGGEP
jgi:hypothetical protein